MVEFLHPTGSGRKPEKIANHRGVVCETRQTTGRVRVDTRGVGGRRGMGRGR